MAQGQSDACDALGGERGGADQDPRRDPRLHCDVVGPGRAWIREWLRDVVFERQRRTVRAGGQLTDIEEGPVDDRSRGPDRFRGQRVEWTRNRWYSPRTRWQSTHPA